jgi:hypothetical protein
MQLTNLYKRTGTIGLAFMTRGNVDDPFLPTVMSSANADAFCLEVLKMPVLDLVRRFEQWAVLNSKREPCLFWSSSAMINLFHRKT